MAAGFSFESAEMKSTCFDLSMFKWFFHTAVVNLETIVMQDDNTDLIRNIEGRPCTRMDSNGMNGTFIPRDQARASTSRHACHQPGS